MDYGRTIVLDLPYAEVVPKVKDAFKEQGFGTLTEIDVRATLREKLDTEVEDYVILGVCNPQLAKRALDVERDIGLLLPCTVVVRTTDDGTLVEALDARTLVEVPGNPQLQPIADEAAERINAALDALAG